MDKKIMLCIINAYEKDGVADINFDNLKCVGAGKDRMRRILNQLEVEGSVKNLSRNGFFPRYEVLVKVECPNFLFDETLTFGDKEIMMLALEKIKVYEEIPGKTMSTLLYGKDTETRRIYRIKEDSGRSIIGHLKALRYVKKIATHETHLLKVTEWGMQVDFNSNALKECKCQYCGDTNPDNFYKRSKGTCRKCAQQKTKERLGSSPETFLMSKVKTSASQRAKLKEVGITKEDILDQLEEQDNKDYYTGLDFESIETMSVDRLNSNIGYNRGNIVITHNYINLMKNDLDIETFKKFIKNIYNNIDNF